LRNTPVTAEEKDASDISFPILQLYEIRGFEPDLAANVHMSQTDVTTPVDPSPAGGAQ
jgi:hypothetical protein